MLQESKRGGSSVVGKKAAKSTGGKKTAKSSRRPSFVAAVFGVGKDKTKARDGSEENKNDDADDKDSEGGNESTAGTPAGTPSNAARTPSRARGSVGAGALVTAEERVDGGAGGAGGAGGRLPSQKQDPMVTAEENNNRVSGILPPEATQETVS